MSWVKDVFDYILELVRISNKRTMKNRHLFVMKAIALDEYPHLMHVHARDTEELARKIWMKQTEEAGTKVKSDDQEKFDKLIRAQTRIGLPDPRNAIDQAYLDKVEEILQEMVEEQKLNFVPPDRYVFRRVT